jgi:glycosyltransferase involved in cell wall biosynthesis
MSQSKITIGIPTFNRYRFLEESLNSVLQQTYNDVSIIISDNASTDHITEEVLYILKSKKNIKYIKNEVGITPQQNFLQLLNLCETEYFTWLQDDDLFNKDFIKRAVHNLDSDPDINIYCAYAQRATQTNINHQVAFWGSPFNLDWFNEEKYILEAKYLYPLSLFYTIGFSPVAVFRKETLLNSRIYFDKSYPIFFERMISASSSSNGKILIDAYIGALFRIHPAQYHLSKSNNKDKEIQYIKFLNDLNILSLTIEDDLFHDFDKVLDRIEPQLLLQWMKDYKKYKDTNNLTRNTINYINDYLIRKKYFLPPILLIRKKVSNMKKSFLYKLNKILIKK